MHDELSTDDIIGAMKYMRMAQTDPEELINLYNYLLDLDVEKQDNKGYEIIFDLISEGALKVSLA